MSSSTSTSASSVSRPTHSPDGIPFLYPDNRYTCAKCGEKNILGLDISDHMNVECPVLHPASELEQWKRKCIMIEERLEPENLELARNCGIDVDDLETEYTKELDDLRKKMIKDGVVPKLNVTKKMVGEGGGTKKKKNTMGVATRSSSSGGRRRPRK